MSESSANWERRAGSRLHRTGLRWALLRLGAAAGPGALSRGVELPVEEIFYIFFSPFTLIFGILHKCT